MRLALILPKNRLWRWHQQLLRHLGATHAVAVFVDNRASKYSLHLRAWLKVELAMYAERLLSPRDFDTVDHSPSSRLNEQEFDVIINLAEHANPSRNSIAIGYEGELDSTALINKLLARQTPHLTVHQEESRHLLTESRPAIDDKSSLTRGLQLSFARCISLLDRALKPTAHDRLLEQKAAAFSDTVKLPAFVGRFIREKASRFVAKPEVRWSVALRQDQGPFITVGDDARRYYADPFLFSCQGRNFMFVEDFPDATQKGVISAAEIVGDALVNAPVPVLERPYHLSYPLVLANGDAIYMLPETSANNALELYRAIEFPWKWQLDRVLIEGLSVADATPLFHDGRWWLFAAAAEHGTTDQDELLIFHSEKLTGPWRAHPGNPVKSDCRSARPGGRIQRQGPRLLRPAQDCEDSYGTGLVWLEITELTPARFREHEVASWDGPRDLGVAGIHSFDRIGELQVIDFKSIVGPKSRSSISRQLTPRSGSAIDRAFRVPGAGAGLPYAPPIEGQLPRANSWIAEHPSRQEANMAASWRSAQQHR